MPLGTGSERPEPPTLQERRSTPSLAPLRSTEKPIPIFEPVEAVLPPPCSQCLELNVDVADINQRDEFGLELSSQKLAKVQWTIVVQFNSDQLAVQPFINDTYGTYTSLHVNRFPLGKSVVVEQTFSGSAARLGLVVGSSGAWTGNQTMAVFVQNLTVYPASGGQVNVDFGTTPLLPLTDRYHPLVTPR